MSKYEEHIANYTLEDDKALMKKINNYFKDCKCILDLGGGTGWFHRFCKDKHYFFVDKNEKLCKQMLDVCPVVCTDLDSEFAKRYIVWKLGKTKVDGISCFSVLEHLYHPEMLMNVIKTILPTGGKIIIEADGYVSFDGHMFFWDDPTHVRPWTEYSIKLLLEMNGFIVEDTDLHIINHNGTTLVESFLVFARKE